MMDVKESDNDAARRFAGRVVELEEINSDLRGHIFSFICVDCGGQKHHEGVKSFYCCECGKPMAKIAGTPGASGYQVWDDVDLVRLVRQMREAQRAYFRNRSRSDLYEAKQLETEVDKILDDKVIGKALRWDPPAVCKDQCVDFDLICDGWNNIDGVTLTVILPLEDVTISDLK